MRITSLTLRSYKSFRTETTIQLSTNFNVFIGPNNCGKSNVLDAIDFLTHPSYDPGRLHYHKADVSFKATLTPEQQMQFGCDGDIEFSGSQYTVTASASGKKMPERIRKQLADRVKRVRYEDFNDLDAIGRAYGDLASKYPKVFSELTRLLGKYFPEIESIDRIADSDSSVAGTVNEGDHKSITIERLGSGFRRVLVILLYALHPDYSVILIDEPEIHLHPGMIKKVRKVLQATKANQIIITTHSPVFVRASSLHQVYRVLKDQSGSHVYYLQQSKRRVDRKRLVQELNSDNVEMFFADKVLLVEGVSDRILMRGLIDRFYKGQDEIKVIYTHGKSNIDIYMDIMQVFHIPYLVLLDRDALYQVAHESGVYTGKRSYRRRGGGRQKKEAIMSQLRDKHIYVLPNGTIEHNYPRKYQKKDTKPLNALYAAANITPEEFQSAQMKHVRKVIEML